MRPTVLVVDDHADFRHAVSALLDAEGFKVVGEAADAGTAFAAVQRLHPDVVLLDVQLPGVDGLTVAEALGVNSGKPAVVLVSSRDASAYGQRLRKSPARGFVAKSALSGAAIRALLD
jgi:DNA-binding NarL/FixJ family response regulator